MEAAGFKPNPRAGHSAILIGTIMYVFGGTDYSTYFDGIHAYDFEEVRI